MVEREPVGDECKVSVDRISEVSDDVLGFILSKLTFKEAAATSILSCRWKRLWTLTPNLYFDGTKLLQKMMVTRKSRRLLPDDERPKFVRWVDQVVATCCSSTSRLALEEFGVYFNLTRVYTEAIDEWLRFAVSNKVEKLELIFTDDVRLRSVRPYDQSYAFPYKKGFFPNGFSFIKKLCTHYVNVSGEALEFFLGNCPLLGKLSVSASGDLETLRVSGTSARFKCLEISYCSNLTSVVVCDSNIESFKYIGRSMKNFHISDAPLLTEIWIGGELMCRSEHVVEMFSSVFPQIERLKFYFLRVVTSLQDTRNFFNSAKLPNVKEFGVHIWSGSNCNDSLLKLIYLIKAAPNVQRFVLEAPSPNGMNGKGVKAFVDSHSTTNHALKGPYFQQLKEVEFAGYRGVNCQYQFLKHLVENFGTIENILVDTRAFDDSTFDRPWVRVYQQQTQAKMQGRAHNAKKVLQKCVPPRINLEII